LSGGLPSGWAMARFLRTAPTVRLLQLLALVVVLAVAGAAIATASSGGGPVPPPKPLARAIHDAMTGPSVSGVTARVTFTNHLLTSDQLQGSSPLLSGASGRLWATRDALRVELQGSNGDGQLVATRRGAWLYDGSSDTVYRLQGAARLFAGWRGGRPDAGDRGADLPTVATIRKALTRLARHVDVSGAQPVDVGGRPAYQATLRPAAHGGLLRSVQVAWDARYGVPLRLAVYSTTDASPVLALQATDVSYGRVSPSVFKLSPPPGAHVVNVSLPIGGGSGDKAHAQKERHGSEVTGVPAVSAKVPFRLVAPASLLGRARQDVRLLPDRRGAGAVLLYGQGLDTLVVTEQPASAAGLLRTSRHHEDGGPGLDLPTVPVNGATAQVLSTPLGTGLRWQSGGVTYTLVGSVSQATAQAAARNLGG